MIELPGHVRAAAAEEGVEEGVVREGGRADADGWHLAEEGDGVVEEARAGVGAEEGVEGAVGEGGGGGGGGEEEIAGGVEAAGGEEAAEEGRVEVGVVGEGGDGARRPSEEGEGAGRGGDAAEGLEHGGLGEAGGSGGGEGEGGGVEAVVRVEEARECAGYVVRLLLRLGLAGGGVVAVLNSSSSRHFHPPSPSLGNKFYPHSAFEVLALSFFLAPKFGLQIHSRNKNSMDELRGRTLLQSCTIYNWLATISWNGSIFHLSNLF